MEIKVREVGWRKCHILSNFISNIVILQFNSEFFGQTKIVTVGGFMPVKKTASAMV